MATITDKALFDVTTGYQRGTQTLSEIDHDRVANAIRYLSYAKLYYPLEYGFFTKSLATRGATESMEDSNYILSLYDFESYFSEFLRKHPGVEQDVNRLSPKEMVGRVGAEEIANAKERRDAARKIAERAVANAAKRKEIEGMIRSAAIEAETPAQLQQFIKERDPIAAVAVDETIKEDPLVIQKLLLSDPESTRGILDAVVLSPLPNKLVLHAVITNLIMDPNKTRGQFLYDAQSIAQTAMALSSGLSQVPAARAGPGAIVAAMLQASGNKTALKAFEQLTQQAKNAVSLITIANAWEKTVDVMTRRAGGAIALSLDPIIREANKQPVSGSIKQAASLVGDVINPLLGRTLADIAALEELNRLLPPGEKILSKKTGAFIASPQELFLLTAYTWKPEGVVFNLSHPEGPLESAVWSMRWVADSAFGKIIDRSAKSEVTSGFFSKILGFFGIRVGAQAAAGAAGGVAGKAATGGLIKIFGSLVGALSGPWGWAVSIIGGLFAAPLFNKVKSWFSSLLSGRIGKLKTAQDAIIDAFGGRAGGRSAQEEQKKTDFYIALLVGVPIMVLITATMFQITVRDSALFVAGQENQPEEFQDFDQTYPPPDYVDFSALASKEFNCLSFGEGIYAGPGPSARLEEKEVNRIKNTINNYPQLKALSCGLGCPDKKITITKFTNASSYGGFAPSARPGNVILYQHTFTRYGDQTFAYLLAHELAHNLDWFNSPIATGFESLGCSGVPSTYKFAGNPSESFAESVALYLIGHPEALSYCGGKAFSYLNQEFSQCR